MSEPHSISCNLHLFCLVASYLGCLWELVSLYFYVCGIGTKQHDYRALVAKNDEWLGAGPRFPYFTVGGAPSLSRVVRQGGAFDFAG